ASLARIEVLDGRSESAMDLLSKAITFYQSLNDRYSIAAQLGNFGLTLRQFGRNDEAKPFLLQSAEIFDEIHLPQYAQQLRRAAS
ncbi:MAG: tetratricopeptide repeat protein, partial [Caldilinea sp.]|nr:tetratricopeptide repeat protein [Caldilinea sp.]